MPYTSAGRTHTVVDDDGDVETNDERLNDEKAEEEAFSSC